MPTQVRIGIKISAQVTTESELRTCWRIADEAGFDHLWNFDHLVGAISRNPRGMFDAWALLAAMAVATTNVRIGCLVTANTYRHPAVLAKTAVTVDHLSGGRLEFGIGTGVNEAEHRMFGIEELLAHRVGRLSESLQAIKMLWTEDRTNFEGRYYQLREAIASPKPLQKPYPPIWIAAGALGNTTLKLVALHADVWNWTGQDNDSKEARIVGQRLRDECERLGRKPDSMRWSAQINWGGEDRQQLAEIVGEHLALGFTEIVIFPSVLMGAQSGQAVVNAFAVAAEELPTLRGLSVTT